MHSAPQTGDQTSRTTNKTRPYPQPHNSSLSLTAFSSKSKTSAQVSSPLSTQAVGIASHGLVNENLDIPQSMDGLHMPAECAALLSHDAEMSTASHSVSPNNIEPLPAPNLEQSNVPQNNPKMSITYITHPQEMPLQPYSPLDQEMGIASHSALPGHRELFPFANLPLQEEDISLVNCKPYFKRRTGKLTTESIERIHTILKDKKIQLPQKKSQYSKYSEALKTAFIEILCEEEFKNIVLSDIETHFCINEQTLKRWIKEHNASNDKLPPNSSFPSGFSAEKFNGSSAQEIHPAPDKNVVKPRKNSSKNRNTVIPTTEDINKIYIKLMESLEVSQEQESSPDEFKGLKEFILSKKDPAGKYSEELQNAFGEILCETEFSNLVLRNIGEYFGINKQNLFRWKREANGINDIDDETKENIKCFLKTINDEIKGTYGNKSIKDIFIENIDEWNGISSFPLAQSLKWLGQEKEISKEQEVSPEESHSTSSSSSVSPTEKLPVSGLSSPSPDSFSDLAVDEKSGSEIFDQEFINNLNPKWAEFKWSTRALENWKKESKKNKSIFQLQRSITMQP